LIIEAIPIDALNALFSVAFFVAVENGISEFTASSLFPSHIEAQFEVAANAIAEDDGLDEDNGVDEDDGVDKDEQTDN
jgi:hypothetical protein